MKLGMKLLLLVFALALIPSSEAWNCSSQVSCSTCIGVQSNLFPKCVWCSADNSCRPHSGHFQLPSALDCVPNCHRQNTLTLPGRILNIVYLLLFVLSFVVLLVLFCRSKLLGFFPQLFGWLPTSHPLLDVGPSASCGHPSVVTGMRCAECVRNCYRAGEQKFGTPDFPDRLPFFTTALSGGGIRAAAHSLGLITALVEAYDDDDSEEKRAAKRLWVPAVSNAESNINPQPLLGPIGIISSVSGGGYTAAGLLAYLQSKTVEMAHFPGELSEEEQARVDQANTERVLEDLTDAVVRSPNYLGGSGPLSSSGALKMAASIVVRASVFLIEFATFAFMLGSLLTSICSCGQQSGRCYADPSGFVWLCPNFLEGSGDSCPSAAFLAGKASLLFGLSKQLVWIALLVFAAAAPPILCTSRHRNRLVTAAAVVAGLFAAAAAVALVFTLFWDLAVLMMYAVLAFQAATDDGLVPVFVLLLFADLLLALASSVLTQATSLPLRAAGYLLLAPSLVLFVTGLPGYFGALTLCAITESAKNWLLFALAMLAMLLLFFEVHILRDLLFRVYVGSLTGAFFPEHEPAHFKKRTVTRGPYLAINACAHGPPFTSFEKQDFDHFLMTPTCYGTESISPPDRPWLYGWGADSTDPCFNVSKLAFAMGLSAAAVAPRAGKIEFPILVRSILALLDVSMGKWFTFTSNASIKDYSHSWIFDHAPLYLFYLAILSSYISFTLFGLGVFLWAAMLLWNSFLVTLVPIDWNVRFINVRCNCRQAVFFRRLAQGASLKSLPADPVYVADGGHFENLGLYYLVRRHAPIIFCSDAAQDTTNSDLFRTLSILKTRGFWFTTIDLHGNDVEVTKDVEIPVYQIIKYGLRRDERGRRNSIIGVIFIVKLAFPTHHTLPPDVRAYFSLQEGEQFSIDSTANQFFSPEQFRAYLEVAQSNTHELLEAILWASQTQTRKRSKIFTDRATAFEVAELGGYGGMGAPGGFTRSSAPVFVHIDDDDEEEDQRASPAVGDQPKKNLIQAVWLFVERVKRLHVGVAPPTHRDIDDNESEEDTLPVSPQFTGELIQFSS